MSGSMMSSSQVAYSTRDFIHDGNYPPMGDHDVSGANTDTFGDPHGTIANSLADDVNYHSSVANFDGADNDLDLDTPPDQNNLQPSPPPLDDDEPQQRAKTVAKPKRDAPQNEAGKYICILEDCDDPAKEFNRKCEWDKHMDKHERPYRCLEDGCEKLPGFTYSGGLLRHEREVHNKHGGPKKPLMCPHTNCKRYAGKPFSRQENLNEHLRRVHNTRDDDLQAEIDGRNGQDVSTSQRSTPPTRTSQRRKRSDDDDEVLQENKRLKQMVSDLQQQLQSQSVQTNTLLGQIASLQGQVQVQQGMQQGLQQGLQQTMDHTNALTLGNGPML